MIEWPFFCQAAPAGPKVKNFESRLEKSLGIVQSIPKIISTSPPQIFLARLKARLG